MLVLEEFYLLILLTLLLLTRCTGFVTVAGWEGQDMGKEMQLDAAAADDAHGGAGKLLQLRSQPPPRQPTKGPSFFRFPLFFRL